MNSRVVFAYTDVWVAGASRTSQKTRFNYLNERYNLRPTVSWCFDNQIKIEFETIYNCLEGTTRIYMWADLTPEQKTEWYLTLGPTSINEEKDD